MTGLVQVAIGGNVAEAEELQGMLETAGIASALEPAEDVEPFGLDDGPLKVLVDAEDLQAARDAIEALAEPDELGGP